MIYTLTLNPAIDYVIGLENFEEGKINKTNHENVYAGGKGINVSTVLKNLGIESVAIGFIAGETGDMLDNMLKELGISTNFVKVHSGMTRINVKLSSAQKETEINGMGPEITEDALNRLYEILETIRDEDILVMSGSIPASIPQTIYCDIASFLRKRSCRAMLVIDSSAKELLDILKYELLLVKPNNHELGALFGVEVATFEDAQEYALRLKDMGAKNVLVSMGAKGALLLDEKGGCHRVAAPKGEVINSVGAGDTTVAAFIAKYLDNKCKEYDTIVRYCVAAGSATAFSEGLATKDKIDEIYNLMV